MIAMFRMEDWGIPDGMLSFFGGETLWSHGSDGSVEVFEKALGAVANGHSKFWILTSSRNRDLDVTARGAGGDVEIAGFGGVGYVHQEVTFAGFGCDARVDFAAVGCRKNKCGAGKVTRLVGPRDECDIELRKLGQSFGRDDSNNSFSFQKASHFSKGHLACAGDENLLALQIEENRIVHMSTVPTVVIVGRPNVGKSTLFNAIHGQRRSIVGDEPGITRDRIRGECEYRRKPFTLIDTGGIIENDDDLIPREILRQAKTALNEASQIIFLIDGRTEITGADMDLAKMLRKIGKPVTLAVNKIDAESRAGLAHEFHRLGFSDMYSISAEHKLGVDELLEHVTREFARKPEPELNEAGEVVPAEEADPGIRVAIIGRPNVGKSTLLNALVGYERAIVSPVAGTTRDAVDETITVGGHTYTFVDTAGIRRKGKTNQMAEKLSVVMSQRHIRMANVCIVVLEATEGVVGLDATIAGYAHEGGRAVILAVNKWDAVKGAKKKEFTQQVRDSLRYLDYAPIAHISAEKSQGVKALFEMVRKAYQGASQRVGTGELNRFVQKLNIEQNLKIYYFTQHGVRPPTFSVFTDQGEKLHFSHQRFLANQLREHFGFFGTPIVIHPKRR